MKFVHGFKTMLIFLFNNYSAYSKVVTVASRYSSNLTDETLSGIVRKPDFCLGENKGADQLRSNCEADQRLCFRYMDSTISLLLKSGISSF